MIIRTWTFLLPLDSRPLRWRYIHTPMRLPVRVQVPLIALLRTPLSWTDGSERPRSAHAGDRSRPRRRDDCAPNVA